MTLAPHQSASFIADSFVILVKLVPILTRQVTRTREHRSSQRTNFISNLRRVLLKHMKIKEVRTSSVRRDQLLSLLVFLSPSGLPQCRDGHYHSSRTDKNAVGVTVICVLSRRLLFLLLLLIIVSASLSRRPPVTMKVSHSSSSRVLPMRAWHSFAFD